MQETNLYTITVPVLAKTLRALQGVLDKAAAHAETKKTAKRTFEEALLNDRIIFDQLPFSSQVRIACDNAKGGAARLAEVEIPSFEDNEKTFSDITERVEKPLAFLETIRSEEIEGKESVHISLPYWNGMHTTGFEYVTQYLLPNFFFHVTTAYSILRKNGVPIGKSDYIGGLPLKD